jgi:hypothetical protein
MKPTRIDKLMDGLKGACVSCGFFAKHAAPGKGASTYFEAELQERAKGQVFEHTPDGLKAVVTAPICFRSAFPLAQELIEEQQAGGKTKEEAARKVLFKNRACPLWFQYQPGLSPQQHLGGLAMQEMEQRQYKFQEDMEERRRQWEQQLENDRRRFEFKLTAVLAIITAAGVITPIVAAVLSR